MRPPGIVEPGLTAQAPKTKWLTVGGVLGVSGGGGEGLRAELDLKLRGKWSLGVASSVSHSLVAGDFEFGGYFDTLDIRAIGYLARTTGSKRWHLRAFAGAGLVVTDADVHSIQGERTARGVFPMAEASLVVARDIGKTWGIHAGPLVSMFAQRFESMQGALRRDMEVTLFGGVRYRL